MCKERTSLGKSDESKKRKRTKVRSENPYETTFFKLFYGGIFHSRP